MDEGGGGDQGVAELFWVGNGEFRRQTGGCDVNMMDPAGEGRKDLGVQPGSQDRAFRNIPPLSAQNTGFQFMDGDDREEHGGGWDRLGPGGDIRMGLTQSDFTKFGDDIGVQQVHQSDKSTSRANPSARGKSMSTSSLPGGMAMRSMMFCVGPARRL